MKGQISFDFILSIIVFLIIVGYSLTFINDLDDKSSSNISYIRNHSTYLSHKDIILSTKYYDSFYQSYDINYDVHLSKSDCVVINEGGNVKIGSIDSNFDISVQNNNYISSSCDKAVVRK